jgi:conjugal transfer mating pair stabilization protein TraG
MEFRDQLAGKIGKLATGASVEGGIKGSISGSGSTGSTDTVGQSGRHSSDSRHDTSSQAAKDFREAITLPAAKTLHIR